MSFVINPKTLTEAIAFLADNPDARPMSGGASLVAMKNAQLIDASHFVNLAGIAELRGIEAQVDCLRIGGMSKHRELAECDLFTGDVAMIRQAANQIANRVVRNMGTIGGAIGNGDPAADYLPVLACADAEIEISGPDGSFRLKVEDYIVDWYETALEPGQIVTAIYLAKPKDMPSVYTKLARTPGDYATASVACAMGETGVRVAVGACGPKPVRSREAEAELADRLDDSQAIARFGQLLADLTDPVDDVRGSSEYRLRLVPRMIAATIQRVRGAA